MEEKFLVKTIDKETIRVEGEKVKAKPKAKAPTWFSEFRKDFDEFKDITVKRLDNIEKKVDENSKNIKACKKILHYLKIRQQWKKN